MFRFASPWFLVLIILPWAWLVFRAVSGRRRKKAGKDRTHRIRVSSLAGMETPPAAWSLLAARSLPLFKVVALSLMIVALARPQAGDRKIRVTTEGVNIILALDLSESMKALDFKR